MTMFNVKGDVAMTVSSEVPLIACIPLPLFLASRLSLTPVFQ